MSVIVMSMNLFAWNYMYLLESSTIMFLDCPSIRLSVLPHKDCEWNVFQGNTKTACVIQVHRLIRCGVTSFISYKLIKYGENFTFRPIDLSLYSLLELALSHFILVECGISFTFISVFQWKSFIKKNVQFSKLKNHNQNVSWENIKYFWKSYRSEVKGDGCKSTTWPNWSKILFK